MSRPIKPNKIKLLQGNPGKKSAEQLTSWIAPAQDICPEMPKYFAENFDLDSLRPEDVWDELSPMLVRLGLLTEIDKNAFARYCDILVEWLKVRKFVKENGTTRLVFCDLGEKILSDPDVPFADKIRACQTWPQYTAYKDLNMQLVKLENEFGFTPAARNKVVVNVEKKDPTEDFFGKQYNKKNVA